MTNKERNKFAVGIAVITIIGPGLRAVDFNTPVNIGSLNFRLEDILLFVIIALLGFVFFQIATNTFRNSHLSKKLFSRHLTYVCMYASMKI